MYCMRWPVAPWRFLLVSDFYRSTTRTRPPGGIGLGNNSLALGPASDILVYGKWGAGGAGMREGGGHPGTVKKGDDDEWLLLTRHLNMRFFFDLTT